MSTFPIIGLAFSGGGFRAATFNLGVLTYLDQVKSNDHSLLECVAALSTVSGGTITGGAYAIGRKRGLPMSEIYHDLLRFLTKVDLVSLSLDRLSSPQGWNKERIRSLICAFADSYDMELFKGAVFGELMNDDPGFHLRHLSFNATEFSNGLQFRFQWSEPIRKPQKGEPARGIIGNYYCRTPESIARQIRMADILAASSCFPGGFEPINFPGDFILPRSPELDEFRKDPENRIGLMDGGIVDNQGIEPLLLADERMMKNAPPHASGEPEPAHAFDLLIISDVASPFMEDYKASVQHKMNFWRNLTINGALLLNLGICALALAGMALAWHREWKTMIAVAAAISALSIILFAAVFYLRARMKQFTVLKPFHKPLRKLLRIKFIVYENLLVNGAKSVMKMTGEVFLKHLRRLNYQKVFRDDTWKNRRLMNAIYELKPGAKDWQKKLAEKTIRPELVPTPGLADVAGKATSMDTTLWFTSQELRTTMPDALVACGQFTICFNLLEYIQKIKADPQNTTDNHRFFLDCEAQMLRDWEKFKKDPYWMVKELKKT